MATTKLVKKSLGNINMESGYGNPDHVSSPEGSIYCDNSSGGTYVYRDSVWVELSDNRYADLYVSGRTSTTSITTGWQKLTVPMITKDSYGVTVINDYEYSISESADYYCMAYLSLDDNAADCGNVLLGVSTGTTVNNVNVSSGYVETGTLDLPEYDNVILQTVYSAPAGSTLSLYIRGSATDNIILNDVRFYVKMMI